MATAKKKTNDVKKSGDVPATRVAARPQAAERRVEAPAPRPAAVQASPAPAATTRTPPAQVGTAPTSEQISRRAFEIWEREGRQPGHDVEHWLQAEAELRGA